MTITPREQLTAARICKVNHAGEYGAIRIYRAQLMVARKFFKDQVPFLQHTLDHEIEHCRKFAEAMPEREARPCRAMWLWSWGGYLLGLGTALCGPNMIMVCTEAVEDAVHHHMNDQIAFLSGRDDGLKAVIESIKDEELEHLHYAQERVQHHRATRFVNWCIYNIIELLIWLSTWGDSTRMKQDLKKLS